MRSCDWIDVFINHGILNVSLEITALVRNAHILRGTLTACEFVNQCVILQSQ
jgi:hypothetical protein